MEFFSDVCFSLLLLLMSLFSSVFISGQNFTSGSKDASATTAAAELIIRTITASLLLTLTIVYYSRNYQSYTFLGSISQLNTEKFQLMVMAPFGNEAKLSKLSSPKHTKLNINEADTCEVNYKNTSVTSNIVAL